MCSDEREQFSLKITDFISHELKLPSENVTPDLIINKGQHMLDSEQIHMILARIADDTGISMTLLRRVFPYDRYFITWKSAGLVMMGIAIFVLAIITFFIGEGTGMGFFVLPLFFLIEAIAFIKYIKIFLSGVEIQD
ncbi:unnamed protein product [Commensalibacter papalotli (ex Botero et al. 2024)]|uniref:Uncharacterized protein n=2 Tax=Commensalibacter papalotli (ex Botero et al. 2024) TaxID=2972766 RepID=A0ABM9HMU8_9PROT|nr:unnamed protein product [Commensalibacter papalotli (ex Botero et al. 2024)]